MKFHPIAAIAVIALAVAACHDEAPTPPDPGTTVVVDEETQADIDECPRRDGTPCK